MLYLSSRKATPHGAKKLACARFFLTNKDHFVLSWFVSLLSLFDKTDY